MKAFAIKETDSFAMTCEVVETKKEADTLVHIWRDRLQADDPDTDVKVVEIDAEWRTVIGPLTGEKTTFLKEITPQCP